MYLLAIRTYVHKYLVIMVREKVCATGTTKWWDLGIALMGQGAAPGLDLIRVDYPNNVVECCVRMFNTWRQTTPTGSWENYCKH